MTAFVIFADFAGAIALVWVANKNAAGASRAVPIMALSENYVIRRVGWFVRMAALTGPWQPLLLQLYKRKTPRFPTTRETILPDLDPPKAAEKLKLDGWAQEFRVPIGHLEAILAFADRTPQQTYENPHLRCGALSELARDPNIVEVARRYIGGEPYLYHSVIWRTNGVPNPEPYRNGHTYQFHFDVADVKSLALFVYLTDVDEHCGPHEVISGTHHRKSLWRTALIYVDEKEAHDRYAGRINMIVGPAGTAFFEEQTVYHRQSMPRKARMMLRITYTLGRAPRSS